jgi:hypothetical protein
MAKKAVFYLASYVASVCVGLSGVKTYRMYHASKEARELHPLVYVLQQCSPKEGAKKEMSRTKPAH